jgi:transcriptional regulator with XRE-family HTH domain
MAKHVIKTFRNLADLSQYELADAIGRNQSWLSQVERGRKTPSLDDIAKLAHALNVDPKLLHMGADK